MLVDDDIATLERHEAPRHQASDRQWNSWRRPTVLFVCTALLSRLPSLSQMAEVIPFRVGGQVDGMDFDQAATACGVQRGDFGTTALPNAMEKYQRECRAYWTTHNEGYAGSKRKTDADDARPARQRNYLPAAEAVVAMRAIIEKYGQRANTARDIEEAELEARLAAIRASNLRVANARAALGNQ